MAVAHHPSQALLSVLETGGKMGMLVRHHDWARTSLGPIADWPLSLLTLVTSLVHAPAPMALLWGPQGIAIYNDAHFPLTGLQTSVLGQTVRAASSVLFRYHSRAMEICLAGEHLSFRDRLLTLDRNGTTEQIRLNLDYSPVIGEDGKPAGVLVNVAETTARHVLQYQSSRAELTSLRNMFEQAPGFMAMLEGPDHVCTLANRAFVELIGHRSILGQAVRTTLPELSDQGFFDILDECYRSGEPHTGTGVAVRLQRAPGGQIEHRYVDYVYQPIRDQLGEVSGIFVEGSDVTGRVSGDAALRESEARFREVANAAPVLIWLTDENMEATWYNSSWYNFTGRHPGQDLGHGWLEAVHPDDLAVTSLDYEDACARLAPFRLTYRLKRKDGAWRYMFDSGVPRFLPDGTFIGYIGSCVDVTEALLVEAELRRFTEQLEARVEARTRELASVNQELVAQINERQRVEEALHQMQRLEAVGQLTSGVAHDFNNLLTVVLGNIEFLDRDLARAGVDGKVRDRLARMKEAAQRGAKLTSQMLAFARRQHLEPKPANLNSVISNMRSLLRTSVGGSLGLSIVLESGLWNAMVDKTQIELVILNLAINARDAMSSNGGQMTIRTANATMGEPDRPDAPPAGDYVVVSVADNGSGMSPDVLAKAYEPFFTTKSVGKGSGLGLPQMLGFAMQSGGGARIDTTLGVGTVVSVYLPRSELTAETDPLEQQAPEITRLSGTSRTVLLVDDDDDVREVSAALLHDLGCTVAEAKSGRAAIDLLAKSNGFDLLVVDFAMPEMNGIEVARAVLARDPDIPVLYVTGYADLSALGNVGDDMIVKKPFRNEEFVAKVKRLLPKQPRNKGNSGSRRAATRR